MPGNEPADGKNTQPTVEIRVARIGLISAVVVAVCGLVGTLVTVFGTAISAYFSSQAAQVPVALPIRATQTAEARLVALPPTLEDYVAGTNTFLLKNHLVLPVRVYINDVYLGELPTDTGREYVLDAIPSTLRWELAKETTSSGRAIGDAMGATVLGVSTGQVVEITNLAGDQVYFYPYITNLTDQECEVIINKGWESENIPEAVVPANREEIGLGYYRLFTNSNVTLDCDGSIRWWGLQPDENSDDSFYDLVETGSGTITFSLKP
jgi:hypothetical protein